MSYSTPPLQLVAGGNISPNRCVKGQASTDSSVLQASANSDPIIGISQPGTHRAAGTADDDGYAAVSGEAIQVWGPGSICQAEASGSISPWTWVTTDSNGRLAAASSGNACVGMTMQQANALGDLVLIIVMPQSSY